MKTLRICTSVLIAIFVIAISGCAQNPDSSAPNDAFSHAKRLSSESRAKLKLSASARRIKKQHKAGRNLQLSFMGNKRPIRAF